MIQCNSGGNHKNHKRIHPFLLVIYTLYNQIYHAFKYIFIILVLSYCMNILSSRILKKKQ